MVCLVLSRYVVSFILVSISNKVSHRDTKMSLGHLYLILLFNSIKTRGFINVEYFSLLDTNIMLLDTKKQLKINFLIVCYFFNFIRKLIYIFGKGA